MSPLDLDEFEKEQIETLVTNLSKPKGDRIPHPDQDYADEGMIIPKPGFTFRSKSQKRMLVAIELMRF